METRHPRIPTITWAIFTIRALIPLATEHDPALFLNGSRSIPTTFQLHRTYKKTLPRLHESVWYRIRDRRDYRPANLPPDYDVVNDKEDVVEKVRGKKQLAATPVA